MRDHLGDDLTEIPVNLDRIIAVDSGDEIGAFADIAGRWFPDTVSLPMPTE